VADLPGLQQRNQTKNKGIRDSLNVLNIVVERGGRRRKKGVARIEKSDLRSKAHKDQGESNEDIYMDTGIKGNLS